MSWLYRHCVRPFLFLQESEAVHGRTVRALGTIGRRPVLCKLMAGMYRAPEMPAEVFGLKFPNPLGLAAGMDKQALAVPSWEAMGFGFCELGGVTWHPQSGNPGPRAFRAVPDQALINRMGSNNPGAIAFAEKLAEWRARGRWPKHPVGINLSKSKLTPLEKAAEDYANTFRALWAHGDFFVVNLSSPNTPGLHQLQEKSRLGDILTALQQVNADHAKKAAPARAGPNEDARLPTSAGTPASRLKPILIKVAPDLAFEALDEILELVGPRQIAGIVATNTTVTRPQASSRGLQRVYSELGGLSGKPLRQRSTEVVRHLYRQTQGTLPIIGVGGIFTAEDAWKKVTAGATLLQVYTGLVYEGPSLARNVVRGLQRKLQDIGLSDLRQAVGITSRI